MHDVCFLISGLWRMSACPIGFTYLILNRRQFCTCSINSNLELIKQIKTHLCFATSQAKMKVTLYSNPMHMTRI